MIFNKRDITFIAVLTITTHLMGTSSSSSLTSPTQDDVIASKRQRVSLALATQQERQACFMISPRVAKNMASIPDWFCGSPMHALVFEDLNYADLSGVRRTSKAFKAMAKQVIMPTGQRWVSWFLNKFKDNSNQKKRMQAFADIVSAIGRSPNALVKLREIVRNYYRDVPATMRFWNFDEHKKSSAWRADLGKFNAYGQQTIVYKDNLFTELKHIEEGIKKLETEHKQARKAVIDQAQATAEKDLAELKERQKKILAPLKERKHQLIHLLLPSLQALAPYAVAHRILSALGEDEANLLPTTLPLVINLDYRDLSPLAYKRSPAHEYELIDQLTYICIPSVHDSLAIQTDSISRSSKALVEDGLIKRIVPRTFDASLDPEYLIKTDHFDVRSYNTKINLLRLAANNMCLTGKQTSQIGFQEALYDTETDRNQFIFARISDYLADERLLKQKSITAHILWLMENVIKHARSTELQDCRTIAIACDGSWKKFLNGFNDQPQRIAHILRGAAQASEQAVNRAADILTIDDLRRAIWLHLKSHDYSKAAAYSEHLFTEFGTTDCSDYINACRIYYNFASHSKDTEAAKRNLAKAMEYITRGLHIELGKSNLRHLKKYVRLLRRLHNDLSAPTNSYSGSTEILPVIDHATAAINEKITELEAAANPQP